jgi:hypothetical protein
MSSHRRGPAAKARSTTLYTVAGCAALLAVAANTPARALLPEWLQHIVGASAIEGALYRAMPLPVGAVLYPRPPKEAQAELATLAASAPDNAELYRLRGRADEQALDETAAERDWKLYATHANDPVAAKLQLANFYQRRMLAPQEIAVLNEVAAAPPVAAEMYLDPSRQRSWLTFERILTRIDQQGLPASETAAAFNAFLLRYPDQPAVYAAMLEFELDQHDWNAAVALIGRYKQALPHDEVFPIRAQALLEYRRGNVDAALAVYDHAFQPRWGADLVKSYLALLDQTHRQRAFVAAARVQLAAHPDGPEALNALARIFYYDQQAGRNASALQTLEAFRIAREARKGAWSAEDLFTLAQLSQLAGSPSEAARYNYALASTEGTLAGGEPAAQSGLAGLAGILLTAPAQPLAISAGNLTLYRDIATLDQGPGYWNGILSLWLNDDSPATEYEAETTKAQGYFDRSKAAELLTELDKRFPAAPERAPLHAALIQTLTQYGDPAAVIAAGKQFLGVFPAAQERLQVADAMADAYAQQNDTVSEFALYEAQLSELAAKTGGLPLTAAATAPPAPADPDMAEFDVQVQRPDAVDADAGAALHLQAQPLATEPVHKSLPEATAYARVLERYLGRLTATGQLPRALTVLRRQLDVNPNDPLLYERLSTFLEQNNLSAPQEEVFKLAIAKFQRPGYYDRLARFYLRMAQRDAFAKLTRQVTEIFSGTELDTFFTNVKPDMPVGPQLALQLNLYAAKRFPHDIVFTHNLLAAYQADTTRNTAAYEALLRRQWWVADDLRDQFFEFLSRTGKLEAELTQLQAAASSQSSANPAAAREEAEIDIFASHFEQAAPFLGSVAALYPADADTGDRAISLFRSLAYLDPTMGSTEHAVAIEKNLLAAAPDSPDRLATMGDLYAEATSGGGEDLASAAPYWHRIPELHPGSTQGFLTSSTIFWDYFQFDDAMADLTKARARFHSEALFGYEAGAIAENRHDLQSAVAEYTSAAIHPLEIERHFDSGVGVIEAWLRPPSDAADSNLRSTAQSFLGSEESKTRLLQLATRPATRAAVDDATAKAVVANPANTAALTLRADVLAAQHHAPELTPLLAALFNQALDRTATLDEATAVGELAEARNLTPVYERALAKQAALTLDPVQKIELQYTLARSMESRNDVAGATTVMTTVYTANPRILGVVRATADFYDRNKQPQRVIGTLLDAAKVAAPPLARDFTFEAASRANEANDTKQARALGLGLLAQTPYDARVLAIIADSYARVHDDAGLKQFYLARMDTAEKGPGLAREERKEDVAVLRRGLIPALTRLHDYKGATDQYIALLSAYPEDANTGQEAALYSLKNGVQPQLLDFLRATVKQSPRDSRFMVLLAQIETTFEDLPAAEQAYSLAIAIRKDRIDLYTARADIEIRLSQADVSQADLAAADFQRLYVLSYHDPSWMVRLAELRARQGRADDAVAALKTAYIAGHAEASADDFKVADQLAGWNILPQARTFAEHGLSVAGADLLTPRAATVYPEPASGAAVYARILTRVGMANEALTALAAARKAADVSATSPKALAAALAAEDIAGEDADAFRKSFAERQRQTADQTLQGALQALGKAVQTWYTPEQKQTFALSLDKLHDTKQPNANPKLALEVATAAGFADREADWRKQTLLAGPPAKADVPAYAALQQARLQFSDLGHTLESYAARLLPKTRRPQLVQSAQAYRDAGDAANETRISRSLVLSGESQLRDRYFNLLLMRNRAALASLAASGNKDLADAALNYSIAHGTLDQALAAVARRGAALDAVWRPASASLVETYFASPASTIESVADFTGPLASEATIADRIGVRPDLTRQITGDDYFFYASRFGIFLATVPKKPALPDAEDFLAAELEGSPVSSTPHLTLAETYVEARNIPAAEAEYNHALELSPSDPAILDELATVLYRANRRDEASAKWSAALAELRRMQQKAMYPETWFTSLETITRHLGERHLTANFRADLETILRPYLTENGAYRSNELLEVMYSASATPAEGANLIVTLADAAPDPEGILWGLKGSTWLDAEGQEAILLHRIGLERSSAKTAADQGQLAALQFELVNLYLNQDHTAQAQAVLDAISTNYKKAGSGGEEVVLAVRTDRLDGLLSAWHADPDGAPGPSILATAITSLQTSTAAYTPVPAKIRPLQEFLFQEKDESHTLLPTDFLSVAQARIDTGDNASALQLLHRLALVSPSEIQQQDGSDVTDDSSSADAATTVTPSPYANLDHAAALLERDHLPAEAVPFLRSLVQLTPWSPAYRLRLAQALFASNARDDARTNFLTLVSDATAPYDLRVKAARVLASFAQDSSTTLGSTELALIVKPTTPAAARQPYFMAARIAAAALPSTSSADRETLLREAIAIAPTGADAGRARLDLLLLQPDTASSSAVLAIFRSLQNVLPAAPAAAEDTEAADSTGQATDTSDAGDASDTSDAAGRDANEPTDNVEVSAAALPLAAMKLEAAARIRLALQLSSAFERDGDLSSAGGFAKLASNEAEASSDSRRSAAERRVQSLGTAVLLAQRNAARLPVLHESLTQSTQVRPRLSAADVALQEAP